MKRIVMLLSVVPLMVVMLAMAVAPASADQPFQYKYYCTQPGWVDLITQSFYKQDAAEQGYDCVKLPKDQWF
jgi:peroxiredoxin